MMQEMAQVEQRKINGGQQRILDQYWTRYCGASYYSAFDGWKGTMYYKWNVGGQAPYYYRGIVYK